MTSSVKVALTVDGADLFKGCTHVSTGIKVKHAYFNCLLSIVNVYVLCVTCIINLRFMAVDFYLV
jgi:hypothetical protein